MSADVTSPVSLDLGTVTAVTSVTHLAVNLGDRAGVPVIVPSSLVGGAMVGSRVLVTRVDGVYTLLDIITGAWIGKTEIYFGATPPAGWLKLDGSPFSSTDYPFLAAHLGGTTLPDARDRAVLGASGTKAAKSTGGSSTIAEANLPAHTHTVSNIGIGTVLNGTGVSANVYYPSGATSNTGSAGSGTAYWPPYLAAHLIIKAA